VYHWRDKTKVWIRQDTGEIVKTDIIPEEDLQEHLGAGELESEQQEPEPQLPAVEG
jgi:hypothetical protein